MGILPESVRDFIAGGIGGICRIPPGHPFDTVKVNLQSSNKFRVGGDVANMLSGEEIMDLFRESGFDILADGTVTNTQLTSSPVITSILSHNFMFVARKR